MSSLSEAAKSVLEPFAGPMVAGMCLRSAAATAHKGIDSLTAEDFPILRQTAEGILRPLAPADAIARLMADVERQMT